jgi:hypothetical protein
MRTFFAPLLVGLGVALGTVACAGASSDDATTNDESTEDALSMRATVKGTWVAQDGTDVGLDLRPDGSFFRDTAKVLNGMFINGARPWQHDTGRFVMSAKHKTITLHVDGGADEVFVYEYKAAPVLNGMFLPGHEPAATLTLTRQPAPMSHVAFQAQHFKGTTSWCTTDQDCKDELADKTWQPYFLNGSNPKCEVATNVCINHGMPIK